MDRAFLCDRSHARAHELLRTSRVIRSMTTKRPEKGVNEIYGRSKQESLYKSSLHAAGKMNERVDISVGWRAQGIDIKPDSGQCGQSLVIFHITAGKEQDE